jgi:hypothetical protein
MSVPAANPRRGDETARGETGAYGSTAEIKAAGKVDPSCFGRVLRLTLLGRDIVEAILVERLQAEVTLAEIMKPPHVVATGSSIGTPRDYSEDMYRFYFELVDHSAVVKELLSTFLGERHSRSLTTLSFGYEFDMPIQCAPDLIRLLARENIAIYQVVRYAKITGVWCPSSTVSKQADN